MYKYGNNYNKFENENGDENLNAIKCSIQTEDPIGKNIEINDFIEYYKIGYFQIILIVVCGVLFMFEGFQMYISTFLMGGVKKDLKLNNFEESLTGCSIFLGIFVGFPFWGLLADRYGRRIITLLMVYIIFFSLLFSTISPNFYILLIFLFTNGVGTSASIVTLTLLIEYVSSSIRGSVLIIVLFFQTFSAAYIVLVAWITSILFGNQGWRYLIYSTAIPFLLIIFIIPFIIPESLRYLSLIGKKKQIIKILKFIEKVNCKKVPNSYWINLKLTKKKEKAGNLKDLFSKKIFLPYLNITSIFWICNFVGFGIILSTPNFFENIGNIYIGTLISYLSEIPGYLSMTFLLKIMKRKTILFLSLYISGIGLILLLIPYKNFYFILFIISIIRSSNVACLLTTWLVVEETIPTSIRTTGIGISASFAKWSSIITPYISNKNIFGYQIPIIIYASFSLLGAILAFIHPLETKEKNLEDVI